MDINLGQLFLQAFIDGSALVADAGWQTMVDNPWMFLLVPGMLLLGLASRRVKRHPRRSF
ncbi:hypothetical protein [Cryobacterium glucosi]|uniref:PEP-CTERM protein-sorting domain-containing protein n=1 Tax=Cryobacterium glucosi TaxID=1259175 RepID=A0ABY2IHQ2_9MICO|nr:hypothetical protein [Cryobacterium glucosi]TFC16556.1 hypothetical protein E3O46_18065 [Cryobacterium glucosi]